MYENRALRKTSGPERGQGNRGAEETTYQGNLWPVLYQFSRYSYWLRAWRSGIESRVGRDFAPVQTGPGAHPASCKLGTGSFSGVKCGRGVLLTTHHLLVPRSWKSRAIPLPTPWATGTLYLYLLYVEETFQILIFRAIIGDICSVSTFTLPAVTIGKKFGIIIMPLEPTRT